MSISISSMIYISLFTSADTPIYLTDHSFVENFEQNHSCSRIEDLLDSRSICFIFSAHPFIFKLFICLDQNVSSFIGQLRSLIPFNFDSVTKLLERFLVRLQRWLPFARGITDVNFGFWSIIAFSEIPSLVFPIPFSKILVTTRVIWWRFHVVTRSAILTIFVWVFRGRFPSFTCQILT